MPVKIDKINDSTVYSMISINFHCKVCQIDYSAKQSFHRIHLYALTTFDFCIPENNQHNLFWDLKLILQNLYTFTSGISYRY